MTRNAWRDISPGDYDAHMSHPGVAQTQALGRIFREQFALCPNSRAAILGITNGNGLEHVVPCGIAEVVGIDINGAFLEECRVRYPEAAPRLKLFQLDLTADTAKAAEIISGCDLIIANLLIKHIRLENFTRLMAGLPERGQIVSCVIQANPDGTEVSHSGFEHVFEAISMQREEENEGLIAISMGEAGFAPTHRAVYDLPNGKQFIRLDFKKGAST
ncbi:MAG: class I SAM-dependent methyltransferase [Oscillospiraceae bacterium]|jgi:hypothetical protein|nr:class I SAM-dependent methyltransferase [Oscillospiraceae bacterium]